MDPRCVLCERPVDAIGAIVVVGDIERPESVPLCRRCSDLSPQQRRSLRDQAMLRALQQPDDPERGSRR